MRLACLLLLVFGLRSGHAEPLPQAFQEVLARPEYQHSYWGFLFVDMATGETLHELNADKFFTPASVTKLFSCAAALTALGGDHRFETYVARKGTINTNGELSGDLILVAGGDPTLGGRTDEAGHVAFVSEDHIYADGTDAVNWTAPDPLAGLKELAKQVVAAGIQKITNGGVWVDDRLFDTFESAGGSGPSRLTPILVNDNLIDFKVSPGAAGEMAKVEWRPQTSAILIDAQVMTVSTGKPSISSWREGPGRYVVRGSIPARSEPVLRTQEVDDPASFARALFIDALRSAGVQIEASPLAENLPNALPSTNEMASLSKVASLRSPPFRENVKLILKVSHNQHANLLPMLVALQHGERTINDGLRREGEVLRELGVDPSAISFGDGAGGSRADLVTPRATVKLLREMAARPQFKDYENALPILGRDGTLASISSNHPVAGHVKAKTGTFTWEDAVNHREMLLTKGLAGYLTTHTGRQVAFAIFLNHAPLDKDLGSKRDGRALGGMCEAIYDAY